MNREQYLISATKFFAKSLFTPVGLTIPSDVKVACSLPSKRAFGARQKTIGQCFPRSRSDANVNEVFISPTIDNSVEVLGVLIHELIHAIDDCQNGHRKPFVDMMNAVGLGGKPTATVVIPDSKIEKLAQRFIKQRGEYPHSKINGRNARKQSTRMIKIECPCCGFKVRASRKVIEEIDSEYIQCWSCGETHLEIGG